MPLIIRQQLTPDGLVTKYQVNPVAGGVATEERVRMIQSRILALHYLLMAPGANSGFGYEAELLQAMADEALLLVALQARIHDKQLRLEAARALRDVWEVMDLSLNNHIASLRASGTLPPETSNNEAAKVASRDLLPGHAYFEYDWAAIFAVIPDPADSTP